MFKCENNNLIGKLLIRQHLLLYKTLNGLSYSLNLKIFAKTFGRFRDNSYLCSANTTEADAKADADGWELHYGKGVYVTLCSLTV